MEVKDYQRLFSVGATEMKMKCRRDLDAGGEGGCSERGPPVLFRNRAGRCKLIVDFQKGRIDLPERRPKMDYEVREIQNPVGSGRFEVRAMLNVGDTHFRLSKSLIEVGAIRHSDFQFQNIEGKPHVIFRVSMGTTFEIYPLISQANHVFLSAIREALRVKKIVDAIRLADSEAGREETR